MGRVETFTVLGSMLNLTVCFFCAPVGVRSHLRGSLKCTVQSDQTHLLDVKFLLAELSWSPASYCMCGLLSA